MNQAYQTRVWWDGDEVEFICWTDKGLVFNWNDARETAVHMPRGAVVRLMDKGVLYVEGQMPTWINPGQAQPQESVSSGLVKPQFKHVERAQPQQRKPSAKAEKLNIVQRLIRKLSGNDDKKVRITS
jgi:hypothetical protein